MRGSDLLIQNSRPTQTPGHRCEATSKPPGAPRQSDPGLCPPKTGDEGHIFVSPLDLKLPGRVEWVSVTSVPLTRCLII